MQNFTETLRNQSLENGSSGICSDNDKVPVAEGYGLRCNQSLSYKALRTISIVNIVGLDVDKRCFETLSFVASDKYYFFKWQELIANKILKIPQHSNNYC